MKVTKVDASLDDHVVGTMTQLYELTSMWGGYGNPHLSTIVHPGADIVLTPKERENGHDITALTSVGRECNTHQLHHILLIVFL